MNILHQEWASKNCRTMSSGPRKFSIARRVSREKFSCKKSFEPGPPPGHKWWPVPYLVIKNPSVIEKTKLLRFCITVRYFQAQRSLPSPAARFQRGVWEREWDFKQALPGKNTWATLLFCRAFWAIFPRVDKKGDAKFSEAHARMQIWLLMREVHDFNN